MSFLRIILHFFIELVFDAFSLLILLRFILQCVKVNFYHPMIQVLVKVTNPVLIPVRRITPIFGSWDWSCIVLIIMLGIVKFTIIMLLYQEPLSPLIVLILALINLLRHGLYIYIFIFIFLALASWFGPSPRQIMVMDLLKKVTNPVLTRFKLKLSWRMIDFRPMAICFMMFLLLMGLNLLHNYFI